ncbi:MAG: Lrp/AsnC family transcriptional regulator [Alphaproteobacteria bacterium]|nr:Lrp/AsnC family transcriptional regulator [Alphaproteobacteria bacterium]
MKNLLRNSEFCAQISADIVIIDSDISKNRSSFICRRCEEARVKPAEPKKDVDRTTQQNGIRSPEDGLNRSIIAMLEKDGRMPFSEIAHKLDVSEGTIRNRVNAMKAAGMLRIVAIADPVVVEYQSDAMIGIRVAPGHTAESVANRLSADHQVVYVLWVAGKYDLLVEVVSDDPESFLTFLETRIHSATDIVEAEVMLGLKNFKNQYLLKRDWEGGDG